MHHTSCLEQLATTYVRGVSDSQLLNSILPLQLSLPLSTMLQGWMDRWMHPLNINLCVCVSDLIYILPTTHAFQKWNKSSTKRVRVRVLSERIFHYRSCWLLDKINCYQKWQNGSLLASQYTYTIFAMVLINFVKKIPVKDSTKDTSDLLFKARRNTRKTKIEENFARHTSNITIDKIISCYKKTKKKNNNKSRGESRDFIE